MDTTIETIEELGRWNNIAPRSYTGRVLCFTSDDDTTVWGADTATLMLKDLQEELVTISKKLPAFAGQLQLGEHLTTDENQRLPMTTKVKNGDVYLLKSSQFTIGMKDSYPRELQSLYKAHDEQLIYFMPMYISYATLREEKFPAEAFINNPDLTNKGMDATFQKKGAPLPVLTVQAVFLDGGFFLNLIPHHTIFDGKAFGGPKGFLDFVSAELCEQTIDGFSFDHIVEVPYAHYPELAKAPFEQIFSECHEYCRFPDNALSGPTQPVMSFIPGTENLKNRKNTSKIFVINYVQMMEYRNALAEHLGRHKDNLGVYPTICALVWAHTFVAREKLMKSGYDPIEKALHEHFKSRAPIFSSPFDWTSSKFLDAYPQFKALANNYFGNNIVWAYLSLDSAFPDCSRDEAVEKAYDLLRDAAKGTLDSIARLASHVHDCIFSIDNFYVAKRHALFDKAPDMRLFGLSMDARMPGECGMNTWKDFGMDFEYQFNGIFEPGTNIKKKIRADCQRRAQDAFGQSGGLILPARNGSEEIELQLSLPEEAMKILLQDTVLRKRYLDVVQSQSDPLPVAPAA